MELTPQKVSEEYAKEIASWQHPGEYSIYNLPSWDNMIKENYSLCDSIKRERFIGYINKKKELIGFGEFYVMKYNGMK